MATPTSGKTYRFNNVGASGKRLNLYSSGTASNGMNVVLYTADNTAEQQWYYNNNRLLIKTNTGFCLDRYNLSSNANHNNADIWAVSSDEDANQKITFVDNGSYFRIKLTSTNLYLTARSNANGTSAGKTPNSAGNVYWAASSTSTLQRWTATEVTTTGGGNGNLTVGARPSNLNYNNSTNYGSGNLFAKGQCTWHCYGRAKEVKGKSILFNQSSERHGKNWWSMVTNCTKTQTPVSNSIAVFDEPKGTYGHVVYVEQVSGNNIYFTEANWDGKGVLKAVDGTVKEQSRKDFEERGSHLKFTGYLKL